MLDNKQFKGGFTLPGEAGEDTLTLDFAKKWGADAIRDSDGTVLSEDILSVGYSIYSTVCIVRAEQEFPKKHPEFLPQKFLISEAVTAFENEIELSPLKGYFDQKYKIDTIHDMKEWWQLFDRTTGKEVSKDNWAFNSDSETVIVQKCELGHVYTINFLVYQIWDSTSMYNHLTNNWDGDHVVSVDPYFPEVREHLMNYFDQWIVEHPNTDVVRLTTLAYHFTIDSNDAGGDKFRDWTGYMDTISIPALLDFEKEYDYRLTSEDFIDCGYFNATHRVPNQKYRDWMKFIQAFVIEFGKELVNKVHNAGKKAAIFQGDHWIGVEPFSSEYSEMGIDINIGACESGVSLRRIADSPWEEMREIRLYPYFFSDMCDNGRDPAAECMEEWVKIRRAMLRNPVDRIGYGGYLSIATQFPKLVDNITQIREEFSDIVEHSAGKPAETYPVKVAVLTSWGKLRSWVNHFGSDQKFVQKRADIITVVGSDMLENLAGLPVDISFLSFDDIKNNGISEDIDVIINDGEAGSAWSGGAFWKDPKIVASIRMFVASGGGFIGSQAPSAFECNGRSLQLSDLLGVERELGLTVTTLSPEYNSKESHFITDGLYDSLDFKETKSFVYPINSDTEILHTTGMHVNIAVNNYQKGRAVYLSQLPYSLTNSRMLLKAIMWSTNKESDLLNCYSDNINIECALWEKTRKISIINNISCNQTTKLYLKGDIIGEFELAPYESIWIDY